MPATFICPSCGKSVTAEAGAEFTCPMCGQVIRAPDGSAPTPPTEPPIELAYANLGDRPAASGLAIASMICGIVGLAGACVMGLGIPVGIVGLVLGIIALVRISRQPARFGGRGMAIAGVCTGALSLIAVPILLAIMLPSLSRARELSKRIVCSSQLQAIGMAMTQYSLSTGAACTDFDQLLDAGYVSPGQFRCPSDAQGPCSYYFVPHPDPAAEDYADPKRIVVYEHPLIHGGEGGNVLWADGHVSFEKSPGYDQLIDSLTLPDGTPFAPHDEDRPNR